MRVVALSCIGVIAAVQALAYQKFEEHRIRGDEISRVRMEPLENEAPSTMIIETNSDVTGVGEIVIESDGDLDACKEQVEAIIGDATSYAQITVQTTAQTMNGVMVTGCSVLTY